MIEIAEWEIACSKKDAMDLGRCPYAGAVACNEDSIFAVHSYGVNDMDVLVDYSERRNVESYTGFTINILIT